MATKVLNTDVCGYASFFWIGSIIWANGPIGSMKSDRINIHRVIVVQDASTTTYGFLGKPNISWDVDLDIYLDDGTVIEVHTDDEYFIKKMMKYVWEIRKDDPRKWY